MSITAEYFLKNYDKKDFLNAIEELQQNNIIFEGQFSFLDDATMRQSRAHNIIKALQYFGFDQELTCLAWEIKNEGVLYCLFFMGQRFDTIDDVKTAHQNYFLK